jgi:cardiolipin synthase (CMP-forming)
MPADVEVQPATSASRQRPSRGIRTRPICIGALSQDSVGHPGFCERPMTNQDSVAGATAVAPEAAASGRIWTIPNAISLARLAGVPVFLWLVLGLQTQAGDWWAVGLLAASGVSDWLDGLIARALNQQSRLGQMLDPAADRLYIVATVIALAVRAIIPWWLVALLALRELLLGAVLAVLRRRGWGALQVSFVGKTATWCLLYAFPLLLLGSHHTSYAETARVAGWTFAIWGSALYWWAAALYLVQARQLLAVRLTNELGTDDPASESGTADRDGSGGSAE